MVIKTLPKNYARVKTFRTDEFYLHEINFYEKVCIDIIIKKFSSFTLTNILKV